VLAEVGFILNSHLLISLRYTWGIVVEYLTQGAGIGIVLLVVKNLLYLIPNQYSTCKAAIKNKEIKENMFF
jgi:hypothetical protein